MHFLGQKIIVRQEYDPLNASFLAHLSIFSHFGFASLKAEYQLVDIRHLEAECRLFDVDMLTPMMPALAQRAGSKN